MKLIQTESVPMLPYTASQATVKTLLLQRLLGKGLSQIWTGLGSPVRLGIQAALDFINVFYHCLQLDGGKREGRDRFGASAEVKHGRRRKRCWEKDVWEICDAVSSSEQENTLLYLHFVFP